MLTNSTFELGVPQADGRVSVTEHHESSDGQSYNYEYLLDDQNDPQMVLEERAAFINNILAQREAAKLAIVGTTVPLTRYEFLSRFTTAERVAVRESAKTNSIVDDFMKMMELSGNVSLVLARPGLSYLASIGVLTAERANTIGGE